MSLVTRCQCNSPMDEIIADDTHGHCYRRGWYCFKCHNWEDAISRERLYDIDKKIEEKTREKAERSVFPLLGEKK